jgi:hypothetical protein
MDDAKTVETLVHFLGIFPEFLRVGILPILQFLQQKKQQGLFGNLYLYTNNQCGRPWTESLVKAIEQVANTPGLFDHIICAFKINNVVVESKRTSQWKTWRDFVRCTLLPATAQICFIDDTFFPQMAKDRVFYLQPRPYHHTLNQSEIARRLASCDNQQATEVLTKNNQHPNLEIVKEPAWRVFWRGEAVYSVVGAEERVLAARLMSLLGDFFNLGLRKPATRKIKGRFWYHLTQKRRHKN